MKKSYCRNLTNKIILNRRNFIFNLRDKHPFVWRSLWAIWRVLRSIKFMLWKNQLKLQVMLKGSREKLIFEKIYWIDPYKIKYFSTKPLSQQDNYSKGLEGDWDLSKKLFKNSDVYRAFKQKFKEGKEWKETDFYHRVIKNMSDGFKKWGCTNREQWEERLKKVESLYYQIKRDGYKPQKEIYSPKGWLEKIEKPMAILDDITVAIGRNGEILLVNARHRLSIARLLNLPKIPVRIIFRHKRWMDFRRELMLFTNNNGELYQPLTHFDLQDIPFQHGELRFNIIKENLSVSHGKLLDIGAELGYFCCRFEDEGFDCHAVEENKKRIYFLNKIKKAENRKFKIVPESIFEYKRNQELTFNVVLALNVFHHFLDTKDTYLNLIKLLKRIKAKEFFFEAYKLDEVRDRYKEYTPEQFVDFIIENSDFKKSEFIGKAEDGRSLYKFT